MIASWMLYVLCVSGLIIVAALAAERALQAMGRPTRVVWAAAMALSALWPLGPSIARLLPAPTRSLTVLPFTIVVSPAALSPDALAAAARAATIDRVLIGVWVVLSVLLAWRLLYGAARLERLRAAWKRGRVNGVAVKLSTNVGPAVVGLRSMDVVLPEWILSLDEPLREIVLRHEEEHRSARDPYLLLGAATLVALMPWNVALWFQARRLRLAIEVDCDARVLRTHPSPERYGMLILTIAQRRSVAPTLFAPMLSEPTTNLERRILAMRNTNRVARATALLGGLATIGVLVFASSLQSASPSFQRSGMQNAIARATSKLVPVVAPETIPVKKKEPPPVSPAAPKNEVLKLEPVKATATSDMPTIAIHPRYPDVLRAAQVEGAVIVRYAFNANGDVDLSSIHVLSATHELFRASVLGALQTARGTPNTEVQTPFVFMLPEKSLKEVDPATLAPGTVIVAAAAAGTSPQDAPRVVSENQTFFEFQVEKPTTALPGNQGPRYPDQLRTAGIEGEVLAQFVVNQSGRPDMSTFKVLRSDHELFTQAVRESLADMAFSPPEVDGRAVKQLVQMPFKFDLEKKP